MPAGELEVRYRRLLRWFPREHRQRHGEEMLGVLLAAAPAGKDRPGLAGAADLLWSALRMRLRPGRALSDQIGWREMLAMYSVVAPIVTLIATCIGFAGTDWYLIASGGDGLREGFFGLNVSHPLVGTILWLVVYGQAAVALLAILGLRRCAVAAAALPAVYAGYLTFRFTGQPQQVVWEVATLPITLVTTILELVALLAAPDSRAWRQLMNRDRWVTAAAVALICGGLYLVNFASSLATGQSTALRMLTESTVLAMVALAAWLTSPAGKRLALIIIVCSCPYWWSLLAGYGLPIWPVQTASAFALDLVFAWLIGWLIRGRRRTSTRDGQDVGVA
jgi:hypothetical protein